MAVRRARAWDVIPDIHADIRRLEASLDAVSEGVGIAFLGDLIDGGANGAPHDDRAVLERVRGLIGAGRAVAVMGNHELNAILYHRTDAKGVPLRAPTPVREHAHRSFLDTFGTRTGAARHWCDWFLTLPLWRDLDGLRLVHAAWDDADIETVAARRPDGCLDVADLAEVAAEESAFAQAVQRLVKGPEVDLPEGHVFHDTAGHARHEVRLAWWRPEARTWAEAVLSVPEVSELPPGDIGRDAPVPFYKGPVPVLAGHYKMTGAPVIEAPFAASIDYPETPCLYRWRGETGLLAENLIRV